MQADVRRPGMKEALELGIALGHDPSLVQVVKLADDVPPPPPPPPPPRAGAFATGENHAELRRRAEAAEKMAARYKSLYEERLEAEEDSINKHRKLLRGYCKLSAENRTLRAELARYRDVMKRLSAAPDLPGKSSEASAEPGRERLNSF